MRTGSSIKHDVTHGWWFLGPCQVGCWRKKFYIIYFYLCFIFFGWECVPTKYHRDSAKENYLGGHSQNNWLKSKERLEYFTIDSFSLSLLPPIDFCVILDENLLECSETYKIVFIRFKMFLSLFSLKKIFDKSDFFSQGVATFERYRTRNCWWLRDDNPRVHR